MKLNCIGKSQALDGEVEYEAIVITEYGPVTISCIVTLPRYTHVLFLITLV